MILIYQLEFSYNVSQLVDRPIDFKFQNFETFVLIITLLGYTQVAYKFSQNLHSVDTIHYI